MGEDLKRENLWSRVSATQEPSLRGIGRAIRRLRVGEAALMLGFPLTGALFAAQSAFELTRREVGWFLLATALLALSVYAVNGYLGRVADAQNWRFACGDDDNATPSALLALALVIASLLAYTLLGWAFVAMASVSCLLWGLYSLSDMGLKNYPGAGTGVHFLSQVLHFQMGYLVLAPLSTHSFLVSVYFALLFSGGHLHHELIDYRADAQAGLRTTAVSLGPRTALTLSYAIFLAGGCYLVALRCAGVLQTWEIAPFLGALALQVGTLIYLRVQGNVMAIVLPNRALYRLYYLLAGMIYALLKFTR